MNKLLSTVHSISNQLLTLTGTKYKLRLALRGPVLFFAILNPLHAEIKIAVIDTGFCSENIKSKFKIEKALDLTNSVKFDCKKMDKKSLRFHGQLVLEEFLRFYSNKKQTLHIYPLIVFNERGDQEKDYWLKALEWVAKNKIDFVLTASGFITKDKIASSLPAIWFVPSGRINTQIKDATTLFPQILAPQENLFLIGDFYDGRQVLYDQGLLYKDKIDYYFPSGSGAFQGTSRAVAEGAALALNLCPLSSLRSCLKKLSKEYFDTLSNNKIQTF